MSLSNWHTVRFVRKRLEEKISNYEFGYNSISDKLSFVYQKSVNSLSRYGLNNPEVYNVFEYDNQFGIKSVREQYDKLVPNYFIPDREIFINF